MALTVRICNVFSLLKSFDSCLNSRHVPLFEQVTLECVNYLRDTLIESAVLEIVSAQAKRFSPRDLRCCGAFRKDTVRQLHFFPEENTLWNSVGDSEVVLDTFCFINSLFVFHGHKINND